MKAASTFQLFESIKLYKYILGQLSFENGAGVYTIARSVSYDAANNNTSQYLIIHFLSSVLCHNYYNVDVIWEFYNKLVWKVWFLLSLNFLQIINFVIQLFFGSGWCCRSCRTGVFLPNPTAMQQVIENEIYINPKVAICNVLKYPFWMMTFCAKMSMLKKGKTV